jgi:N-methylhydantoinase B
MSSPAGPVTGAPDQVVLTLRKKGNTLTFENEGTAPQDGAMNSTYSGWRGALMVALDQLLCWDQNFAIGGALRHVEFNPTLGTFTCATFPASVSDRAGAGDGDLAIPGLQRDLQADVHRRADARGHRCGIGGTSQWPATIFRGIDQWGERYGYLLVDPIGGAIGAFSSGDGISNGGQSRTPICRLPNVEHNEQSFPLLILYRKEVVDCRVAPAAGAVACRRDLLHPAPHRVDHAGHAVPRVTRFRPPPA